MFRRPPNRLLARLRLSPLTMKVDDGQAVRSGDAGWARIVGTDGRAVADFTISDKKADGFLQFNPSAFAKAARSLSSVALLSSARIGATTTRLNAPPTCCTFRPSNATTREGG
jgi:hypothetical protein